MEPVVTAAAPVLGTGVAHADPLPFNESWKGTCKIMSQEIKPGDQNANTGVVLAVATLLNEKYGVPLDSAPVIILAQVQQHCPEYLADVEAGMKGAS